MIWIKKQMKMPLFRPVALEQVMAMEHPLYYQIRKQKAARKEPNS